VKVESKFRFGTGQRAKSLKDIDIQVSYCSASLASTCRNRIFFTPSSFGRLYRGIKNECTSSLDIIFWTPWWADRRLL